MLREAFEGQRRVFGPNNVATLTSTRYLSFALENEGRYKDADKTLTTTLAAERRYLGPEAPETLLSMNLLANILDDEGCLSEAERLYRETGDLDPHPRLKRAAGWNTFLHSLRVMPLTAPPDGSKLCVCERGTPMAKDVLLLLYEVLDALPEGSEAAIKLERALGKVRAAMLYDPDKPADMTQPLKTLTELLDEVPESAKSSLFMSIMAIDETERLCREKMASK